jgi:hypothetical protein
LVVGRVGGVSGAALRDARVIADGSPGATRDVRAVEALLDGTSARDERRAGRLLMPGAASRHPEEKSQAAALVMIENENMTSTLIPLR